MNIFKQLYLDLRWLIFGVRPKPKKIETEASPESAFQQSYQASSLTVPSSCGVGGMAPTHSLSGSYVVTGCGNPYKSFFETEEEKEIKLQEKKKADREKITKFKQFSLTPIQGKTIIET